MNPNRRGAGDLRRDVTKSWAQILIDSMYAEANRYNLTATAISILSQTVMPGIKKIPIDVLRNNINTVEKYCWNAPEFWMPRSVPQIRIGILGSSASSRQKLLNLFYRETSLNEQSGRRFKKIISVCDDPYLVAVREEVGYPTDEFLRWIDVFILISDSSGSNSAAAKYFSILEKYKSAEIVVGILAAIYSISKRKSFKEAFYSLDKTSSCGKVVVNADDMTSVMDLFKEACSAHINRCVERSVSTPTASTPACAKGSTTKPFFCGSPIEIPRNISTRSAMKMGTTISTSVPVTSTPAQTGGKALKTPCVVKPCDVFNTPAAGNASSVVPQTSQQPARIQLRSTTKKNMQALSHTTVVRSTTAAEPKAVRFNLPNQEANQVTHVPPPRPIQTPSILRSPHMSINIPTKSPHVSIIIDSD